MIRMVSVASSNIAKIGYDPSDRVLRVEFKNGAVHDRPDTSPEEYAAFMSSPSLGSYFHHHFRGHTTRAEPMQDEEPSIEPFRQTEELLPATVTRGRGFTVPSSLDEAVERFTRGVC